MTSDPVEPLYPADAMRQANAEIVRLREQIKTYRRMLGAVGPHHPRCLPAKPPADCPRCYLEAST